MSNKENELKKIINILKKISKQKKFGFKIVESDINYAERILLNEGESFDSERVEFIKQLETVDLQAVPGSGKTTTLLAKLLILDRKMPFNDGSGVLVISHTNTAVNEIKNRIEKNCPNIFQYPNFLGTIQSFVDAFLAIPFYANKFHKRPFRIDNEIYKEKCDIIFNSLSYGTKNYLDIKKGSNHSASDFFSEIQLDEDKNLAKSDGSIFLSSKGSSKSYLEIQTAKQKILEEYQCLCFNDAYSLAQEYLITYPNIKRIMQKRFSFIFVDEMQDMDERQHNLLNDIFGNDSGLCSYQRIGDINQAIHTNISTNDVWRPSEYQMSINGSWRLTSEIAQVVKYFGIEYQEVFSLRGKSQIKPHIIVFANPKDVLPKYVDIIKENQLENLCNGSESFSAIGWVGKEQENQDKLNIQSYFPEFNRDVQNHKNDYKVAREYFNFHDNLETSMKPVFEGVLKMLTRILNIEDIRDLDGNAFTVKKFMSYLRENHQDEYLSLKSNLLRWSVDIKNGDRETAFNDMKDFIRPFILQVFEISNLSDRATAFINSDEYSESENVDEEQKIDNFFKKDDVIISVNTIHAVKGRTHVATLYLETFYERGDNYESKRLAPQFLGERVTESEKYKKSTPFASDLIIKSAKMAYVGFSRPTHLLCFAIHKSRMNENFNNDDWNIVRINC